MIHNFSPTSGFPPHQGDRAPSVWIEYRLLLGQTGIVGGSMMWPGLPMLGGESGCARYGIRGSAGV